MPDGGIFPRRLHKTCFPYQAAPYIMPFTFVINAGGQSKRMGQSKALLPVPPLQTPLLRHVLQRLEMLADQTVIITNDPQLPRQAGIAPNIAVYADRYPDCGTLGGIATGLDISNDWAMVVACDMPFVNPQIFRSMQQLATEQEISNQETARQDRWDAIVPRVAGFAEPLHAIYHPRCLPHIERRLENGERRATSFYPDVRIRYVEEDELRPLDPQLHSFINVNTAEEWQSVLAIIEINKNIE